MIRIIKKIFDILYPHVCSTCYVHIDYGPGFCNSCWRKIKFFSNNDICNICAAKLSDNIYIDTNTVCGACLGERRLYFDKLIYTIEYNEIASKLITDFKFNDDHTNISIFAKWMYAHGKQIIESVDIIIPVPLHWFRQFIRKYNQAEILCLQIKKINRKLNIQNNILKRIKYTKPQVKLTYTKRIQNTKNVFDIKNVKNIKGKKILIIDDVVTTYSTVNNCAKILKKNGADKVFILVLAKTVVS